MLRSFGWSELILVSYMLMSIYIILGNFVLIRMKIKGMLLELTDEEFFIVIGIILDMIICGLVLLNVMIINNF